MNNFPYIIAGLPQLALDFESRKSNFDSLVKTIYINCSKRDQQLIDWLLFGIQESNLTHHFYRIVPKLNSPFMKEYFDYDLILRNIKVAFLSRKNKISAEPYLNNYTSINELLKTSKAPDFGLTMVMDEAPKILQIMDLSDLLDREQQLDMLKWNKANEICTFKLFDMNVILCFILKASIIERWNKLDKAEGAKFLKLLISELRSSKNI